MDDDENITPRKPRDGRRVIDLREASDEYIAWLTSGTFDDECKAFNHEMEK